MNGQLLELWGRWLTNALHGQNQMDMMSAWWLRGMQDLSPFAKPYTMLWGLPYARRSEELTGDGLRQVWESVFQLQQLYMTWMQMVPQHKYDQVLQHAEELEGKIREQSKAIDRLRKLLNETGGENNVVVSQLQELIGQQSDQFKQMTQNVSDYIKSSAQKVTQKK